MLTLFLQFLIRLFFHRPTGITPGQRAADMAALFSAIEDSARRQFGPRHGALAMAQSWRAPKSAAPPNKRVDDFFFGI